MSIVAFLLRPGIMAEAAAKKKVEERRSRDVPCWQTPLQGRWFKHPHYVGQTRSFKALRDQPGKVKWSRLLRGPKTQPCSARTPSLEGFSPLGCSVSFPMMCSIRHILFRIDCPMIVSIFLVITLFRSILYTFVHKNIWKQEVVQHLCIDLQITHSSTTTYTSIMVVNFFLIVS